MRRLYAIFLKTIALECIILAIPIIALSGNIKKCPQPNPSKITIKRPLNPGSDKTFDYTFEYQCKDPSYPITIFIPGGPGQAGTDIDLKIKGNINLIKTDPRGTGVNNNYWVNGGRDEDLSSEVIADDIVAIAQHIQTNNFILHGTSFGTVVATIAASKMEKLDLSYKPKAVYLEGTMAKAMNENEQSKAMAFNLENIEKTTEACLDCHMRDLLEPRGPFNNQQLAMFIDTLMNMNRYSMKLGLDIKNYYPRADNFLDYQSKQNSFETLSDNTKKSIIRDQYTKLPINEEGMRVYNAIACNEFFQRGITTSKIAPKGTLGNQSRFLGPFGGSCPNPTHPLKNPYYSKEWQVNTPIYYFVGSWDVATPPDHAYYHYINQKSINKKIICVKGAGHNPLSYDLAHCREGEVKINFSPLQKNLEGIKPDCYHKIVFNEFIC